MAVVDRVFGRRSSEQRPSRPASYRHPPAVVQASWATLPGSGSAPWPPPTAASVAQTLSHGPLAV